MQFGSGVPTVEVADLKDDDFLLDVREDDEWQAGHAEGALHIPLSEFVARYGEHADIPDALTDYIRGRVGYDYSHYGRAGNPDTDFVPDDVIDRFCVLGSVADHIAKLRELESLGVTQFNIYLMHDDMDGTLEAYGHDIIPAMHPLAAS